MTGEFPSQQVRLLILEDQESDARLALRELARAGFVVQSRRVQTEADYLLHLDPGLDVILADYNLPSFDALTALRLLRERGLDIPFILVSGTIGEEVAVEAMKLGANDYVLKDRMARLGKAVARVLEEKRLRDERKKAEIDLAERTHLTALAADVGAAFTAAESLPTTLTQCTEALVQHLDASLARLWTLNSAENRLEMQASSGLITRLDDAYQHVPVGQLKVGLVAQERRPHMTNDLDHDDSFTNLPWARQEGLTAFAGYPLILQDQLVGVVAIFSRRPLTEFQLRGLASIADQMAVGIQQMRAEQSLRESEERYRDLFENAHDLILSVSPDGHFLYVNRAWSETLDYTDQDLAGLRLLDLVPPERRHNCADIIRHALAGEERHLEEMEFVSKSGKRIVVEGGLSTRSVNGKIVSLRGIFRDLTERKKWEAQLLRNQRMESIGTLAGGIAHDLNNALAPILMSIELLRSKFTDPESEAILETIAASAQRGGDMVKQVLTFSRGIEGQRVEVQLRHLINEMQKVIKQTFPKNLTLRTNVVRDLWTVTGDATQLHQVLLNLCVNARDAMPHGGTLSIKAENLVVDEHFARMNSDSKVGSYVMVRVADTGTGISPDIQERIFDPFFTTKPPGQGTGLGLSTVRGIVKSHGGFISVYSEVGRGTEFKIYLPAFAASPGKDGPGGSAQPSLPMGKGEVILVVDDEASVRTIAEQTLIMFGYQVVTATDGAQAVAVCAQHKNEIRLVVIDMVMPVMDGPAAIRAIRSLLPQIRIIAASGLPVETSGSDPEQFHANAVLHKPYTAERLLKLIREVLDR